MSKMDSRIVAVVVGLAMAAVAFTSFATRTRSACEQLSPNPNPAGSQHNFDSRDGCNELDDYENFGTLINSGKFDNAGALRNFGKLHNLGALNNFGDISNVQSRSGNTRNDGTLNNFGNVGGYGSTKNTGILNNYGTFNAGDFGENSGVINNYSDATLSSEQRFTNDGVVNNTLGGTVRTGIGWINNGTLDNGGSLDFEKARFLNNKGIIRIHSGASLETAHEINNAGLINCEGTLTSNGVVNNSGRFYVSGSGIVTGVGVFGQSAGVTLVDGTLSQTAVRVNGGTLSGSGSIESEVTLTGGTMAPGSSAVGAIGITGSYTQTGGGEYAVDIGGSRAGVDHDVMRVSGTVRLDGQLRVVLYDSGGGRFAPGEADTFDILRADSIVGVFSGFRFAPLDETLEWKVSYLKDADGSIDIVRLSVNRINGR
jgi:hypothetical protein